MSEDTMGMRIEVKVDNVYDDATVTDTKVALVSRPSPDEDLDDWAFAELYPMTGTGRVHGDAGYFVEITACDRADLVGRKFEWGV